MKNDFQILDKDGMPFILQELDDRVAEFWGRKVDETYYSSPKDGMPNWIKVIALSIANQRDDIKLDTWTNVKSVLIKRHSTHTLPQIKGTEFAIYDDIKNVTPYLNLIRYWESLGYQPKRIKYDED